jgi:anti-sigma regulatory factor (Ser/Thr protein kinase)
MARPAGAHLEHDAFLYGSDEQLVTAMAPFLREGLAQGQAAWGMGLWVARRLSDALAIQSGPDGTSVRLAIGR